MGALSTWTSWVTIIGVGLALGVLLWPRIRMWVTRRFMYRFLSLRYLTLRQSKIGLPRHKRLRRWLIERIEAFVLLVCVPIQYRLSAYHHAILVSAQLRKYASTRMYLPGPETNPELIGITAYVHYKRLRVRDKDLKRRHRGVRCAGGCTTRYGGARRDDNLDIGGGGGFKGSGGWHCGSEAANGSKESCIPKATGDHYCRMCTHERRDRTAEDDSHLGKAELVSSPSQYVGRSITDCYSSASRPEAVRACSTLTPPVTIFANPAARPCTSNGYGSKRRRTSTSSLARSSASSRRASGTHRAHMPASQGLALGGAVGAVGEQAGRCIRRRPGSRANASRPTSVPGTAGGVWPEA